MQRVESADWHEHIASAIADGYVGFVTFTAVDDDGIELWLRLRHEDGDDAVLVTAGEQIDTIIDLLPEASWFEREIAEMFGVHFNGHDTQPLLLAPGSPTAPMRKSHLLESRNTVAWPGGKEPGESGDRPPSRRRLLPPGVKP